MAPYQVFTNQNYPYLQKHSGMPGTEIAILKYAFFFSSLWGMDGGVNPLGPTQPTYLHNRTQVQNER